jgi:NADH-ubiquinone oxidoreductase chain 1
MFFTSLLAETNRTPFDFAEGESELVSGFNVEYRSGGFVLIFLGEYARIIMISLIRTVIFLGSNNIYIYIYIIICGFAFSFI